MVSGFDCSPISESRRLHSSVASGYHVSLVVVAATTIVRGRHSFLVLATQMPPNSGYFVAKLAELTNKSKQLC